MLVVFAGRVDHGSPYAENDCGPEGPLMSFTIAPVGGRGTLFPLVALVVSTFARITPFIGGAAVGLLGVAAHGVSLLWCC